MIMRPGSRQVWVDRPEEVMVGRGNRQGQVEEMGALKSEESWGLTQTRGNRMVEELTEWHWMKG